MFFDMGAFNASFVDEFCRTQFGEAGPVPGFGVLPLRWGARAADFATASYIIFSNGLLDPWSSGGWAGGWQGRRKPGCCLLSACAVIMQACLESNFHPRPAGGFLSNLSDSLVAVVIPEAGHHVDLYWPEPEGALGHRAAGGFWLAARGILMRCVVLASCRSNAAYV